MKHEFVVVPDEERPPRGSGRAPSELSLIFATGKTIFVPYMAASMTGGLRSKRAYLTVRGFKVFSRKAERDGVTGVYLWAERDGAA